MTVRRGTGSTAFLRALTARQHAHAARLMSIYAAAEGAPRLTVDHFRAATAWTDYSVQTARTLFGDRIGGDLGRLLTAIRDAGPAGLNTAGQHAAFGRHIGADRLTVLRDQLAAQQLVAIVDVPTGGRSAVHAVAITPLRTNEGDHERVSDDPGQALADLVLALLGDAPPGAGSADRRTRQAALRRPHSTPPAVRAAPAAPT